MAEEISVEPEQVFAALGVVFNRLSHLPPAEALTQTTGATGADSDAVAKFALALNRLGEQLSTTVDGIAKSMIAIGGQIREAVRHQVELDATFSDEADTITALLDGLERAYPEYAAAAAAAAASAASTAVAAAAAAASPAGTSSTAASTTPVTTSSGLTLEAR
ncbi:hypothetical protein [Agromyces larvae]|uniref:Uncharacterized protein n=1 Tax=Agromyces larvae TaxID=2929802 RepID=A0ABY4C1U0_9MICO|nr:hypothetical protein [Agromyces larvae]UOE43946.1 hypothetical protein MTO99_17575 [Agromyces larvae]